MLDILKSVGKHYFIYGFGNVVNRILGFLLIPFYTHYLTTSDYGTLELIELTGYIAGMFLAAGISNAVLRFYYDSEDTDHRKLVVSTAHVSVYGIALFLSGWLIVFSPGISGLVFKTSDYAALFRMAFAALALTVGSEVTLNFIRAQQKSTLFTIITVSRLLLGLSLNIVFLVGFGWGIRGIILSGLITQFVGSLVLSAYTIRHTGLRVSRSLLKQMISYGLPYVPAGVGVFVLHFSDRFFIERFTTLSKVGIYALGYKFGMVLSPLLTEPFLAIWRPKMFEFASRDDASQIYAKMFTYFLLVGMTLGLLVSILVQDLIRIMSPPEFHDARFLVPLIALAYIVWGCYFLIQVGILVAKKTKHVAYIGGAAALLNLGLNYTLIPRFGLWGAAWSTLCSCLCLCVLGWWISDRYIHVPYEWSRLLRIVVAAAGVYWVSAQITIPDVWVAVPVKLLLIALFPVVLLALGFYSPSERSKVTDAVSQIKNRFKKS